VLSLSPEQEGPRGITTILLSLFCVLAFATSVAAECAWVLWRSVSVGKLEAQVPTLAGAFPAFDECTASARRD
jgi:hypothetical protein